MRGSPSRLPFASVDDPEDVDLQGENAAEVLYYLLDISAEQLASGPGVLAELSMLGSGALRKVMPQAALIYNLSGDTGVYTSPGPLTFVRQPVTVDYIEGDIADLADGPDAGTLVATVGVAELYGADTGVGRWPTFAWCRFRTPSIVKISRVGLALKPNWLAGWLSHHLGGGCAQQHHADQPLSPSRGD